MPRRRPAGRLRRAQLLMKWWQARPRLRIGPEGRIDNNEGGTPARTTAATIEMASDSIDELRAHRHRGAPRPNARPQNPSLRRRPQRNRPRRLPDDDLLWGEFLGRVHDIPRAPRRAAKIVCSTNVIALLDARFRRSAQLNPDFFRPWFSLGASVVSGMSVGPRSQYRMYVRWRRAQ